MGRRNQNQGGMTNTMLDEEDNGPSTGNGESGPPATTESSTPPAAEATPSAPPAGPPPDVSREKQPGLELDTPAQPTPRQGSGERPFCPKHLCLMSANKSTPSETIYRCPVFGCSCSEKRARPTTVIPREPKHCPQRTCEGNRRAFLEVVPEKSRGANVYMRCPVCGFHMNQPRPELKAVYERDKKRQTQLGPDEDLGAR